MMREERRLWSELIELKTKFSDGVWCVLGDFSVVRKVKEKRGELSRDVDGEEMEEFNNFIQVMEIVETRPMGRRFTWYKANSHCKSILDRFLVSKEWLKA